jgi:hypothetical protein
LIDFSVLELLKSFSTILSLLLLQEMSRDVRFSRLSKLIRFISSSKLSKPWSILNNKILKKQNEKILNYIPAIFRFFKFFKLFKMHSIVPDKNALLRLIEIFTRFLLTVNKWIKLSSVILKFNFYNF